MGDSNNRANIIIIVVAKYLGHIVVEGEIDQVDCRLIGACKKYIGAIGAHE